MLLQTANVFSGLTHRNAANLYANLKIFAYFCETVIAGFDRDKAHTGHAAVQAHLAKIIVAWSQINGKSFIMANSALQPGTILHGKEYTYRIVKVLGQGTFGITYLATTQIPGQLGHIDVQVAIKEFFMRDINGRKDTNVTASNKGGLFDEYKRKFAREALNLSRMRHSGIVKVLETFEANSTSYYSMEFCTGGSLDEIIKKQGSLPEEQAIEYFKQIASALAYMHSHRMLHLDLKPGNIVLRGSGETALIDFGLSKQFGKDNKPESSTSIGSGTPGYAPIEQANYSGSHHAKGEFPATMDVYALGGTLFKMLTGKCPPEASEIFENGFPYDMLQIRKISQHTTDCIARAMQPRRADRYQSVADFASDLTDELPVTVIDTNDIATTDIIDNIQDIKKQKYKPSFFKTVLIPSAIIFIIVLSITLIFFYDSNNESDATEAILNNTTNSIQVSELAENQPMEEKLKNEKITNSKGITFEYTGDAKNGMPHGYGTGIYENGKYVGQYTQSLRDGNGSFTTSDGLNHYEGTFSNDYYDTGTLTLTNDNMYFKGRFVLGAPYDGSWYDSNNNEICKVEKGEQQQ